jgi:hypothetical protein
MTTIAFDTLKYAERLEKAGIPREHAKAEAEALADVLASGAPDLATKNDITALRSEMREIRSEMREMRSETNGEMKLLRWMVGMSLALSTGTVALLAKLFFILPH